MKWAWAHGRKASSPLPSGPNRDALDPAFPAHEIFYDPLALPISTGIGGRTRGQMLPPLISMRSGQIRAQLPGVHCGAWG